VKIEGCVVINDFSGMKLLYDNWLARNKDLYFYFSDIFPVTVDAAISRAHEDRINIGAYKTMFMPVGFSIENIALMAAVLKPSSIELAYTEITRRFHFRHDRFFRDQLNKFVPGINISEKSVPCDDQMQMERLIVEWIDEMRTSYGISHREMAIDVTGGTKPMSIGAHNASLSFDKIDAFYLRTDYDIATEDPVPGTERLMKVRKTKAQVDDDMIFVAMPFKDEFNDVYEQVIKKAISEIGKKSIRVDEQVFTGPIMEKVNDDIIKANIIVAELTEYNPNVYYELGLAHGYNKNVIMMTQDIAKIPFDLRHMRIVKYDRHKMDESKELLKNEISNIARN